MTNSPLVSVVITSYNQKNILSKAINSVLSQTYKNIQIVIADDASTDGSQNLAQDYYDQYPNQIKLVLAKHNQGIPKNKNQGFRAADGEFITYLDGDDYYFPEKIEKEIQIFQSDPDLDIVYSNFVWVDENHILVKRWNENDKETPIGDVFEEVFSKNFPHKTLYRNELIRADILRDIHYYDEKISAYHDWDSRIRMTKGRKVGYSSYVGSAYVDDSRGISKTTKQKRLLQEMRHVIEKNSYLLDDIPIYKKMKIVRGIEMVISKKEANLNLNLWNPHFVRYLMLSGDIEYLKKAVKKSFSLGNV